MNDNLKSLFDKKKVLKEKMEGIYENVKKRGSGAIVSPEERKTFDELEKEITDVNGSIEFHHKLEKKELYDEVKRLQSGENHSPENYLSELPVFNRNSKTSIAEHYAANHQVDESLKGMTLGTIARIWQQGPKNEREERALAEGTTTSGGYTVPSYISSTFVDMLRPKSTVLRAGANVIYFDGTNSYSMAKLTTGLTVEWLAENATQTPADLVFGNVQFAPKTLRALVVSSNELVQDSLNLDQIINAEATRAFATELDRVALVGSGTGSEPQGIANYTNAPFIWNGANGETPDSYDEIISLIYELQANNANVDGTSAAIMHPRTLGAYNLLKSSADDQPLRRPDYIKDMPFYQTTSIGITDSYGSSNAASKLFIGDWSQLYFGIRNTVTIQPLNQRYAENNQTGFLITMRADVKPLHEQSLGYIKGILGATLLT